MQENHTVIFRRKTAKSLTIYEFITPDALSTDSSKRRTLTLLHAVTAQKSHKHACAAIEKKKAPR